MHNNQHFYSKVAEIRRDLTATQKSVPLSDELVARHAIALMTYARYEPDCAPHFNVLRTKRGGLPMLASAFRDEFALALTSDDSWYGETVRADVVQWRVIAGLDDAPYIEPGLESGVSLALVRARAT